MSRFKNKLEQISSPNGFSSRTHNKRITAYYNEKEKTEEDNVIVILQSILPESELGFDGNFVKGNYKQTGFKLTMESAFLLMEALRETLFKYQNNKNI